MITFQRCDRYREVFHEGELLALGFAAVGRGFIAPKTFLDVARRSLSCEG